MTTSADRVQAKQQRRAEREAQLAGAIQRANLTLPTKRYGVIYADPPWTFEVYNKITGNDRGSVNHYPTMDLDAIKAIEVPAADDCVLFIWRTAPALLLALQTVHAWGFHYKSELIWQKDRTGTGYWARNRHEVLIIATRGHPVAPAPGTQSNSIILAPVTTHSTKPIAFHQIIEAYYPNTPKIELFARNRRPGWDYALSPELSC